MTSLFADTIEAESNSNPCNCSQETASEEALANLERWEEVYGDDLGFILSDAAHGSGPLAALFETIFVSTVMIRMNAASIAAIGNADTEPTKDMAR